MPYLYFNVGMGGLLVVYDRILVDDEIAQVIEYCGIISQFIMLLQKKP